MSQATNLLQNVYLFKDLTAQELESIAAIANTESFNAGEDVFSEGDQATALYVVKFGSVKIKHSGKSDEIAVTTLGSGAHFGEMAFIDGEKRSATVTVVEKSEIVSIGFEGLKKVLNSSPESAVKVYRALALFLSGRLRLTTNDLSFAREKNLRHF